MPPSQYAAHLRRLDPLALRKPVVTGAAQHGAD